MPMKGPKTYAAILTTVAITMTVLGYSPASGCNVCHSKNPKMVNMHRELGYKDCFKCHGVRGKKSQEERKRQMEEDLNCTGCHRK